MKEETKIFKNNIIAISVLVIVLILGIVGVTLAISYTMSSNVNISTATLAVDYSGSTVLASDGLVPIEDSTVIDGTNAANVMKTNFTIKGVESNPTNTKIIYDVVLTDINIDSTLSSAYHQYFKWRLTKNGSEIATGTFNELDLDGRNILTRTQQELPPHNATPDSYELAIWITESCPGDTVCGADKDQTPMLGKQISGTVSTNLYTTK